MKYHENIRLYIPESFEWLILASGVLKDAEIQGILEEPSVYIESRDFFSWERYFTKLLVEKSKDTFLEYSKKKINPAYLKGTVREATCPSRLFLSSWRCTWINPSETSDLSNADSSPARIPVSDARSVISAQGSFGVLVVFCFIRCISSFEKALSSSVFVFRSQSFR